MRLIVLAHPVTGQKVEAMVLLRFSKAITWNFHALGVGLVGIGTREGGRFQLGFQERTEGDIARQNNTIKLKPMSLLSFVDLHKS